MDLRYCGFAYFRRCSRNFSSTGYVGFHNPAWQEYQQRSQLQPAIGPLKFSLSDFGLCVGEEAEAGVAQKSLRHFFGLEKKIINANEKNSAEYSKCKYQHQISQSKMSK